MEVTRDNFREQLLPILQHIANATYVTFDLEMSGINARPRERSRDIGKPSLQQQYDENKQAAEMFQVLQVGITCVEENREKDFYLARPFNFPLSPLTTGSVDIKLERNFAFSSSACDFLTGCGFDFGKVFSAGVPYLSQKEEFDLRDEFAKRADNNDKIPDLVIPLEDTATLKFFRDARKKIGDWVKDKKPDKDQWLNIARDGGALNGYQRRLIHQLVRTEFPGYRTFARNSGEFMQIEKLDEEKEKRHQQSKLDKFNGQIAKQKGLRWVYEALTNGDLEGINPRWFCDPNSEDAETELVHKTREFEEVKEALRTKAHIIVGHNLFTDLIFLYRTFVGILPRNIKSFQDDIHEAFPVIFDTKYLASHGDDKMQLRANLKELLTPFKKIHTPLILLDENHTTYGSVHGKEHEAGFDSWMTAELFAKLSVKLYKDYRSVTTATDTGSSPKPKYNKLDPSTPRKAPLSTLSSEDESSALSSPSSGGVKLSSPKIPIYSVTKSPIITETSKLPSEWHAIQMNTSTTSTASAEGEGGFRQWIPRIKSSFWNVYMNKLRVNAIDTGVCDLEEHDAEKI